MSVEGNEEHDGRIVAEQLWLLSMAWSIIFADWPADSPILPDVICY
jgi:hypothetical protein